MKNVTQSLKRLDHANVTSDRFSGSLGHEDRITTEIYLHSIGEAERQAVRVFKKMTEHSHMNSHIDKEKGWTQTANALN